MPTYNFIFKDAKQNVLSSQSHVINSHECTNFVDGLDIAIDLMSDEDVSEIAHVEIFKGTKNAREVAENSETSKIEWHKLTR